MEASFEPCGGKITAERIHPSRLSWHHRNYYNVLFELHCTRQSGRGGAERHRSEEQAVYASSRKLAEETGGSVTWSHQEPLTGSRGDRTSNGTYIPLAEFNADGVNVGFRWAGSVWI